MARRGWSIVGGIPLVLAVVVAVRPNALGSDDVFDLYNLAITASVGVLAFGLWHWRPEPLWPWVLIALTIALWVVGDVVYGTYGSEPAVSLADVFYLAGYVTLVLGVLRLVKAPGSPRGDSVLDMAVVGVAAFYASWALVVQPSWARSDVSQFARVILVTYPVLDAALLVLLARLLFRPRLSMSHVFLASGMAIVFVADMAFAVLQQTKSFTAWSLVDSMWPLGYAVIALAALHPSVGLLPAERAGEDRLVDPKQLLAASAAVLLIPTVAVVAYSARHEFDGASLMAASICLFVLVSWRMIRLRNHAEHVQAALDRSGQYFRGLAMHSSDAFAVISDDGIVTDASPALEEVIGWTRDQTIATPVARHLVELVHRDDAALARSFLERARCATDGRPAVVEARLRRPDRTFHWVEAHATNLRGDPAVRGIVLNLHDIDERKRAEQAAEQERARLETAQQLAGLGSFEQDLTTPVIHASAQLCRVLGIPVVAEFEIDALINVIHPDDRPTVGAAIRANKEEGAPVDLVHRVVWPDGTVRWVHAQVTRTVGDDGVLRVVGTVLDITERKRAEDDLAYQGLHDALTGLANRTLLLDRLDLALRQAERATDPIAVLLMDVDDFKTVNDALGHAAGDDLLVALARRLASATRVGDTLARLGGDEFAVLLGSGAMPQTAESIARRIATVLRSPFPVGGTEVEVSVSIGIAVAEPSRNTSGDLLRDADLAMYLAKQQGPGGVEFAHASMQDAALRHLGVVTDLRRAQVRGELDVYYQAVVRVADEMPAGAEALIRWNHPLRGLVFPVEFISEAEATGLIVPIGDWILHQACRQAQAWRSAGTVDEDFYLGVNISPRQLADPGLVDNVALALAESGLKPHALVLEITESTLMGDFDVSVARLRSLKDLGVRIALDDYGTGYSSLNRLATLPVDIVKIDKSFIDQLTVSAAGRALVGSVIDVTRALGMTTVAEGVEQPDQRVALQDLGCDYIQGYLFARPMPSAQTADLLRALRREKVLAAERAPMP